jgi:hypothetical protein
MRYADMDTNLAMLAREVRIRIDARKMAILK